MQRIGLLVLTFCFSITCFNTALMAKVASAPEHIKVSSSTDGNKVLLNFDELTEGNVHVSLYDSDGTLVDDQNLTQNQRSMEFNQLEKGTYWLSIKKQEKVSLQRVTVL